MNIGITIDASLGIKNSTISQSIVFMADLFIRAGHRCVLITNKKNNSLLSKQTSIAVTPYTKLPAPLDICIEAGFQYNLAIASEFKKAYPKCKFIRFYFKDECLLDNLLLTAAPDRPSSPIRQFDEVWTYDHLARTAPYLKMLHKCAVKMVPLIWDSKYLNKEIKKLKTKEDSPFYAAKKKNIICILEENKTPYSTCLVPLTICEKLNQKHPEIIHKINVTNCDSIKKTQRFRDITAGLSICDQDPQKAYFNNKWNNLQALSRWGKVVISNNISGDLSLRHLEFLYLELPLLHNVVSIKDFGYYYDSENISNAVNQLQYALTIHDKNLDYYKGQAKECLSKFSGFSQINISAFKRAINK
jgi:hypothetical protein